MKIILSHFWTLLLFYTLLKVCEGELIVSGPVRAAVGESVSLRCEVKGPGPVQVVQSQWSRCPDLRILVFSSEGRIHLVNQSFEGHVSMQEYHTFTLLAVQPVDFGDYCCKVTTFPSGTLEGRIELLEETGELDPTVTSPSQGAGLNRTVTSHSDGLFMMILYISCGSAGFLVLLGITIGVVCRQRRKKACVHVRVPVNNTLPDPQQKSDPGPVCSEVEDDEVLYLNISSPDSH